MSGNRGHSKTQLQTLAVQNGGSIVQNPLPNDPKCICIAGDRIYLVERLMQQQPRTNDILRMDWLLRVCQKQQIELRPKDVLSATDALQAQFDKSFDKLGDSFTDVLSSQQELQEVLQDISETELDSSHVEESDLENLEQELLGATTINIFSNHIGYFYNKAADEVSRLLFMQHGGKLVSELEEMEPTFVFVCSDRVNRQNFEPWHLKNFAKRNVKTVSTGWIRQSHQARSTLPTTEFLFKC